MKMRMTMKKTIGAFTALLLAVMTAVTVIAAPVSESAEPAVGSGSGVQSLKAEPDYAAPVSGAERVSEDGLLVANRTINEIRKFYKDNPTVYSGAMYASEPVIDKANGNYSAGELSKGTLNAALNTLNLMRYTAGIDGDVACDDDMNKAMQASSLLMAAHEKVSRDTTKTLTQLKGMSNELYNLGTSSLNSANLNKSNMKIPETLIKTWLGNSSEEARHTLGYRRSLLNPKMKYTGFGYNNGYLAMFALDTSRDSGYSKVAWPAQNTPIELFAAADPWCVSVGEEVTKASVVVTSNSGKSWSFEATQDCKSTTDDGYCNINNVKYGLTGCIIFAPKDITVSPDDYYLVSIKYNGDNAIEYGVRFFTLETEVGYTVSFSANGGSDAPKLINKETGEDIVIPDTEPVRTDYQFKGWALSPNAKTALYQPGDKYTDDANAVLYAVWKALYQGLDKAEVKRISGENRFKTAVSISRTAFESADTVVMANAFNYPDALAGVTLAKAADAPILLCSKDDVNEDVLGEIKRLGAKKIYILGGTAAISEKAEKKLMTYSSDIVRLAGNDRSATAVEIAKELERITAHVPDCIYLACDSNFPDALAISPVAAIENNPILYMPKSGAASNATASYIKAIGCEKAVILGGEMAVSEEGKKSVEDMGLSVERIQGKNRYITAAEICAHYDSSFTGSSVILATGKSFPDALAGGVLAARTGSPVLLVDENWVADESRTFAESRKPDTIIVLGGLSAVSSKAVDQLTGGNSAGTKTTTTTTTTKKTSGSTAATKSTSSTGTTTTTGSTSGTQTTTASSTTSSTTAADKPSNWNGRTVYLTFNDGPSSNTAEYLKILNNYKVKASFFVTYWSGQESRYKAIVSGGHTIGMRSYAKDYGIYSSSEAYFADLEKIESYIKKVTGISTKYIRFPGGSSNTYSKKYKEGIMTELSAAVTEKGYKYFDWNADSGDSVSNSVSKENIIANVQRDVKNNTKFKRDSMIIFTDSVNKKSTVEALPEIIEWLQKEGYAIKPIDESTPTFHMALQNAGENAA